MSATEQGNNEPEDLVDSMLKKTGCSELHYKVQVNQTIFNSVEQKHWPIDIRYFTFFTLGVHCWDARLAQVPGRCEGIQSVHDKLHK